MSRQKVPETDRDLVPKPAPEPARKKVQKALGQHPKKDLDPEDDHVPNLPPHKARKRTALELARALAQSHGPDRDPDPNPDPDPKLDLRPVHPLAPENQDLNLGAALKDPQVDLGKDQGVDRDRYFKLGGNPY